MIGIAEAYRQQVRRGLMIDGWTDPVAHCALGLTGEAGEVADLVKKSQYLKPKPLTPESMQNELGDVLWYLTALADKFGLSLEDLIVSNVTKLEARHPDRYSVEDLRQRAGVMDDSAQPAVRLLPH